MAKRTTFEGLTLTNKTEKKRGEAPAAKVKIVLASLDDAETFIANVFKQVREKKVGTRINGVMNVFAEPEAPGKK